MVGTALEHKEMREAPRCSSGGPNATPAVLMAETQLFDELPLSFQVGAVQVLQQAAALGDHSEQGSLYRKVLGGHPEVMRGAVGPSGGEDRRERGGRRG